MIHFFRDVLDGPLYIVIVILSIIFIMAIIGFIMERKQLEKEKKASIAVVDNTINTPIQPVTFSEKVISQPTDQTTISNIQTVQNNTVSVNPTDSNQI